MLKNEKYYIRTRGADKAAWTFFQFFVNPKISHHRVAGFIWVVIHVQNTLQKEIVILETPMGEKTQCRDRGSFSVTASNFWDPAKGEKSVWKNGLRPWKIAFRIDYAHLEVSKITFSLRNKQLQPLNSSKYSPYWLILLRMTKMSSKSVNMRNISMNFEVGVAFFAMKTLFLAFLDVRNRSGTWFLAYRQVFSMIGDL